MQDIIEIAQIVTKYQLKKVKTFFSSSNKPSNRLSIILSKIQNGEIKQPTEFAEAAGLNVNNAGYRMFAGRFRNRLLNTILFLDFNNRSTDVYIKTFVLCSLKSHTFRVLYALGARNTALKICKTVLKLSEEYNFLEMGYQSGLYLRSNTAHSINLKEYNHYNNMVNEFLIAMQNTSKAAAAYEYFMILTQQSAAINQTKLTEADNNLKWLKKVKPFKYNKSFLQYEQRLIMYNYTVNKDYSGAISFLQNREKQLLNNEKSVGEIFIMEIYLQIIDCCIYVRGYNLGHKYFEKTKELNITSPINWFTLESLYFLLNMHTANFKLAIQCWKTVNANKRFKDLPQYLKDLWNMYGIFCLLIQPKDEVDEQETYRKMYKVFGKQLKSIHHLTRDKEGYNLALRIIEMVMLARLGNFEGLHSRTDAIKRYYNRYLKRAEMQRSVTYVKLILISEKEGFDPTKTYRKTHKLVPKLKEPENTLKSFADRLEIIPYDYLWPIFTEALETGKRVTMKNEGK